MNAPPVDPTAAEPAPPPRPAAWFLLVPARTLGPLTRDELLGWFNAGLVGAEAKITGPEWDGEFSAAAAAQWLGVALRTPVAEAKRDPASLPPLPAAPIQYRRAGIGWRGVALWVVALLAVQMAIVPASSIAGRPDLAAFVLAVAWRFALVVGPCFVVVAGLHRLLRGLWPGARGPLLAATAVYAVLAARFALAPTVPVPAPVPVVAAVAADAPGARDAAVVGEDPTDAWAREEFAAFEAERAAAAMPSAPQVSAAAAAPAGSVAGAPVARRVAVDPDPWNTRARALHSARDWRGLLEYATHWSQAQPGRYEPWQFLGIAQYELGQRDAAVASFERALAAGSQDRSTLYALAGAYVDANRFREAADMSQRILDDEPDTPYVLAIQGRAMSALGEYDEAVAALEHAIRLRPRERYYYGVLANIHFRGGFPDRGRAAVDKANTLL